MNATQTHIYYLNTTGAGFGATVGQYPSLEDARSAARGFGPGEYTVYRDAIGLLTEVEQIDVDQNGNATFFDNTPASPDPAEVEEHARYASYDESRFDPI